MADYPCSFGLILLMNVSIVRALLSNDCMES